MSVDLPPQGSGGFFMSARKPIVIYDTTLRDGAQGPAVSFSAADKERIARLLDAIEVCLCAARAGASWVVLCDTNGGSQPDAVRDGVEAMRAALANAGSRARVGIHTHNDCELAVANSLAGVMAGADMVQGTINGYGERCGNANLVSVVANLVLKLGVDALPAESVEQFRELPRTAEAPANLPPPL